MTSGLDEARRRERAWQEVDRKHGGECPHEDVDPMFGACNLCGVLVNAQRRGQRQEKGE